MMLFSSSSTSSSAERSNRAPEDSTLPILPVGFFFDGLKRYKNKNAWINARMYASAGESLYPSSTTMDDDRNDTNSYRIHDAQYAPSNRRTLTASSEPSFQKPKQHYSPSYAPPPPLPSISSALPSASSQQESLSWGNPQEPMRSSSNYGIMCTSPSSKSNNESGRSGGSKGASSTSILQQQQKQLQQFNLSASLSSPSSSSMMSMQQQQMQQQQYNSSLPPLSTMTQQQQQQQPEYHCTSSLSLPSSFLQQQQQQQQLQPVNSASLLTPTASPPITNGLFLGLAEPKKIEADTATEDAEYRRAMEAALYAADVIQHEHEQQKKKKGGPILVGFGSILSKTQGLFTPSSAATTSKESANNSLPLPSTQYDIHVDDVHDDDNDSTNRNRLPPWLQSSNHPTNNNTSNTSMSSQQQQSGELEEAPKTGTPRSAAVVGASVVGAVAGLAVMGPIAGVVAAGGAAYAAATKEGRVGNVLRGTGAVVAKAGVAASHFEKQHHLVANTAAGVVNTVGWVKQRTTQSTTPSTTPTASSAALTPSTSPSPSSFTTITSTPSTYDETY